MPLTIALIHSPLVGPLTWSLVGRELVRRGVEIVMPELTDDGGGSGPFWRQHVEAAAIAIGAVPDHVRLVLAGHSGAGPLLPAIGARLERKVDGYLFVDAGIPEDRLSRLALMEREDPEFAAWFRDFLAAGGRFPAWSDAELAPLLPGAGVRHQVIAGLRPRGAVFFEEPIPVPARWPDAPCGYLQLSGAYDRPAQWARDAGWPVRRIDAGHFHLLVDPGAVATAIMALIGTFDDEGMHA